MTTSCGPWELLFEPNHTSLPPCFSVSTAVYVPLPVTKGVSGILVFTEDEVAARRKKTYPCIRCGQCLQACPAYLNPSRLGILARSDQSQVMEEQFHLNDCFECGSCTFTCPSGIPLVQYFRMAKVRNRERKAKK